jgi:hypothetical protein
LFGCGAPDGPVADASTLSVVSGAIPEDTVVAPDSVTIVLDVRDRGTSRAGIVVLIGASQSNPSSPLTHPYLLFPAPGAPGGALQVSRETDPSGRITVRGSRGTIAGSGFVPIQVTALDLKDSIPLLIRPGKPNAIRLSPADTAVFVHGGYVLRARVVDQYLNPVNAPISFATTSAAVAVSSQALVVATAFGRSRILATSAGVIGEAQVSVVPDATLAVTLQPRWVKVTRTDGSDARVIDLGVEVSSDRGNSWTADGSRLIFALGPRLFVMDSSDRIERLIQDPSNLTGEAWPQASRDGQWIYFAGSSPDVTELWRVKPDGSHGERIGPAGSPAVLLTQPSPSPDGTRLVFTSNAQGFAERNLAILTIATGTVVNLAIAGEKPRWSPTADLIAFVNPSGEVQTVSSDGSNLHAISAPGIFYGGRVDWSPDGRWIAVTSEDQVQLIEANTGLTLPLPFLQGFEPAWRPTSP